MSTREQTERSKKRGPPLWVRRTTLAVILTGTALVATAFRAAGLADEFEEVQRPQPLVETTVWFDPAVLPDRPTEGDWYVVAVQALQRTGWDGSPNLISVSMPAFGCKTDPRLERPTLRFANTYFDGLVPGIKFASVTLDPVAETAFVNTAYQLLRWRYSPMKISDIRVGFYEALEIAVAHGGQEFRQSTRNRCEINPFLSKYEWHIEYFTTDGRSGWPDSRIFVDTRSGEVRRLAD